MTVPVLIRGTPFDPWAEVAERERARCARPGAHGAAAVFVGTMRDFNEGSAVSAMTLEYYPGMTERHLQRIGEEAGRRWPIDDWLIVHRVGAIEPGEAIVVVGAWSAHRAAAFEACRFLIEDLKSRAPFWKKEAVPGGHRWVERNTPA